MGNIRIGLTIPPKIKEQLEKESKETGIAVASIIKKAINEYLKNEQKK